MHGAAGANACPWCMRTCNVWSRCSVWLAVDLMLEQFSSSSVVIISITYEPAGAIDMRPAWPACLRAGQPSLGAAMSLSAFYSNLTAGISFPFLTACHLRPAIFRPAIGPRHKSWYTFYFIAIWSNPSSTACFNCLFHSLAPHPAVFNAQCCCDICTVRLVCIYTTAPKSAKR